METISFKRKPLRNSGIFHEKRRDIIQKLMFLFVIIVLAYITIDQPENSSVVFFSQEELLVLEKNFNTIKELNERSSYVHFEKINKSLDELYSYLVKNNGHQNVRPAPSFATVVGLVSDIMVNIDLAKERNLENAYFLKENLIFQLRSPSQFIIAYQNIGNNDNKIKGYEKKLVDMLIKIKQEFYIDPKLVINESKNKQKLLLAKRRER